MIYKKCKEIVDPLQIADLETIVEAFEEGIHTESGIHINEGDVDENFGCNGLTTSGEAARSSTGSSGAPPSVLNQEQETATSSQHDFHIDDDLLQNDLNIPNREEAITLIVAYFLHFGAVWVQKYVVFVDPNSSDKNSTSLLSPCASARGSSGGGLLGPAHLQQPTSPLSSGRLQKQSCGRDQVQGAHPFRVEEEDSAVDPVPESQSPVLLMQTGKNTASRASGIFLSKTHGHPGNTKLHSTTFSGYGRMDESSDAFFRVFSRPDDPEKALTKQPDVLALKDHSGINTNTVGGKKTTSEEDSAVLAPVDNKKKNSTTTKSSSGLFSFLGLNLTESLCMTTANRKSDGVEIRDQKQNRPTSTPTGPTAVGSCSRSSITMKMGEHHDQGGSCEMSDKLEPARSSSCRTLKTTATTSTAGASANSSLRSTNRNSASVEVESPTSTSFLDYLFNFTALRESLTSLSIPCSANSRRDHEQADALMQDLDYLFGNDLHNASLARFNESRNRGDLNRLYRLNADEPEDRTAGDPTTRGSKEDEGSGGHKSQGGFPSTSAASCSSAASNLNYPFFSPSTAVTNEKKLSCASSVISSVGEKENESLIRISNEFLLKSLEPYVVKKVVLARHSTTTGARTIAGGDSIFQGGASGSSAGFGGRPTASVSTSSSGSCTGSSSSASRTQKKPTVILKQGVLYPLLSDEQRAAFLTRVYADMERFDLPNAADCRTSVEHFVVPESCSGSADRGGGGLFKQEQQTTPAAGGSFVPYTGGGATTAATSAPAAAPSPSSTSASAPTPSFFQATSSFFAENFPSLLSASPTTVTATSGPTAVDEAATQIMVAPGGARASSSSSSREHQTQQAPKSSSSVLPSGDLPFTRKVSPALSQPTTKSTNEEEMSRLRRRLTDSWLALQQKYQSEVDYVSPRDDSEDEESTKIPSRVVAKRNDGEQRSTTASATVGSAPSAFVPNRGPQATAPPREQSVFLEGDAVIKIVNSSCKNDVEGKDQKQREVVVLQPVEQKAGMLSQSSHNFPEKKKKRTSSDKDDVEMKVDDTMEMELENVVENDIAGDQVVNVVSCKEPELHLLSAESQQDQANNDDDEFDNDAGTATTAPDLSCKHGDMLDDQDFSGATTTAESSPFSQSSSSVTTSNQCSTSCQSTHCAQDPGESSLCEGDAFSATRQDLLVRRHGTPASAGGAGILAGLQQHTQQLQAALCSSEQRGHLMMQENIHSACMTATTSALMQQRHGSGTSGKAPQPQPPVLSAELLHEQDDLSPLVAPRGPYTSAPAFSVTSSGANHKAGFVLPHHPAKMRKSWSWTNSNRLKSGAVVLSGTSAPPSAKSTPTGSTSKNGTDSKGNLVLLPPEILQKGTTLQPSLPGVSSATSELQEAFLAAGDRDQFLHRGRGDGELLHTALGLVAEGSGDSVRATGAADLSPLVDHQHTRKRESWVPARQRHASTTASKLMALRQHYPQTQSHLRLHQQRGAPARGSKDFNTGSTSLLPHNLPPSSDSAAAGTRIQQEDEVLDPAERNKTARVAGLVQEQLLDDEDGHPHDQEGNRMNNREVDVETAADHAAVPRIFYNSKTDTSIAIPPLQLSSIATASPSSSGLLSRNQDGSDADDEWSATEAGSSMSLSFSTTIVGRQELVQPWAPTE
ncbi:unnamed protein product [Amoebophrya sp. A120]|nr:unnamed protein product [Amoebophrya sp. A120]|eukprot:GSA120T00010666001.1